MYSHFNNIAFKATQYLAALTIYNQIDIPTTMNYVHFFDDEFYF